MIDGKLEGKPTAVIGVRFDAREYPKDSGELVAACEITFSCETGIPGESEKPDYIWSICQDDPAFKEAVIYGLNHYLDERRALKLKNELRKTATFPVEEIKTTETQLTINSDEVTIT